MITEIGSRLRITNPSPDMVDWCKKHLEIPNPEYQKKARMNLWLGDTPRTLVMYEVDGDSVIIPFGCLRSILPLLEGDVKKLFECDVREIFPFDLMWVANGDWEIVVENLTPMNFKEAFKLMKQGYPVKLPSWGGYWYWDATKETIVMHTKDGRELDIRETKRVEYTTLNILSDEWVLASTKNCPAMGGEATFSFGEAIKYLKRGHKVARKGWNGKKQYIQLASGISYKAPTGDIVNCEHDAIGNMAVAFVGTSGVQMGWLASQADMLANDWVFAE